MSCKRPVVVSVSMRDDFKLYKLYNTGKVTQAKKMLYMTHEWTNNLIDISHWRVVVIKLAFISTGETLSNTKTDNNMEAM